MGGVGTMLGGDNSEGRRKKEGGHKRPKTEELVGLGKAEISLGFLSWGGTWTVLYFLGGKLDCFFFPLWGEVVLYHGEGLGGKFIGLGGGGGSFPCPPPPSPWIMVKAEPKTEELAGLWKVKAEEGNTQSQLD